ncbi:MAG: LysR family transcriptional regulator [Alphaproteobacteria bacterium]
MRANQSLDPRLLYQLHIILDSGSLSAAADFLSVSQPTLSRNVSLLEAHVGRPLMVRGRHGVTPTEAGIRLAEQGRKIGSDLKQADEILNALQNDSPQTVRFGMGPLIAQALMNEFVSQEFADEKAPPLHLEVATARELIAKLIHGRLDFAVMVTPPDMKVEHLSCIPIADEHIGLFAGPKSRLKDSAIEDQAGLRAARWLVIDAAFAATSSHDNMLKRIGLPSIPSSIQFNMDAIGLIKVLSNSDALAFLPAKIGRLLFEDSGVSEIPLGDYVEKRQISIWHQADANLYPTLEGVIRRCSTFLRSAFRT